MSSATEVLDRLDRATSELHAASQAAIQLAKATVKAAEARSADDDDWRRMPGRKERAEGGWSLRKLQMQIAAGVIRKKSIIGCPYYSAADVRKIINA